MIRLIILFGFLLLMKLGLSETAEQLKSSTFEIKENAHSSVNHADLDFQN